MSLSKPEKVCDLRGLLQKSLDVTTGNVDDIESNINEFLESLAEVEANRKLNKTSPDDWEAYKKALATVWSSSVYLDDADICTEVLKILPNCIPKDEGSSACREFWFLCEMVSFMTYLSFSQPAKAKESLLKCKQMFDETQPGTALFATIRPAIYFTYHMFYVNKNDKDKAAINGVKYLKFSFESGAFEILTWLKDLLQSCVVNCIATARFRQSHYLIRAGNAVIQKALKTEKDSQERAKLLTSKEALDVVLLSHFAALLKATQTYAECTIAQTGELKYDYIDAAVEHKNDCIIIEGIEVPDGDEILSRMLRSNDEILKVYKLAKEQVVVVKNSTINNYIESAEKHLDDVKHYFNIEF